MIKIRNFKQEDFPEILEIEKECFGKDAYSEEVFSYFAKQGELLVAEEKQVLGYILYSFKGTIFSIAVKPEFQNKKIGSLLLSQALKNLDKRCSRVWLQTRERNEKAIKFFEKFGFRAVGKLRRYYKNEDGILMVKEF